MSAMKRLGDQIPPFKATTYRQAVRLGGLVGADGTPCCQPPKAEYLRCPDCGAETDARGISLDGGETWTWVGAVGHECPKAREKARAASEEEAKAKLEEAMEKAGIPIGARNLTADDFCAIPAVGAYLSDAGYRAKGGGLYIYSPVAATGTGKSLAAGHVAAEMVRRGQSARMASEPVVAARLQAAMGDPESSVLDVIHAMATVAMLVIDDLGKQKVSEWYLSMLFAIVDERDKRNKPTLYTSQYSLDKMKEIWAKANPETAEAIASRIEGNNTPVEIAGPDLRRV